MEDLRELQVKHLLAGDHDFLASWVEFDASPYDNMYSIDSDFLTGMLTTNEFMTATEPIVRDTARRARHIFSSLVSHTVSLYLSGEQVEFEPQADKIFDRPTLPSNIIVHETPFDDQDANPNAIDFVFAPLKARSVDPLVATGLFYGMPLSHLDAGYHSLLDSQKTEMAKTKYLRLLVNPVTAEIIKRNIKEIEQDWAEVDAREGASDNSFQNIIRNGLSFGRNGFVQLVWAC